MARVEMREIKTEGQALVFEGSEDCRVVILALKRLREDIRYSNYNDRIFSRVHEMLSDIGDEILDAHGSVISVNDSDSQVFG